MKRKGRTGSMLGRRREMWRMLVVEVGVGGAYVPDSRKGFMLDIRRSEDAEGESRMIGSGRRFGFFGCDGSEGGIPVVVEDERVEIPDAAVGPEGRERVRPRYASADLRTWEKSCEMVCQYGHKFCSLTLES